MVGTIVYQLTRSMTPEQIKQSGYDTYFVDHTAGVFPQFASGTPWTAATIGVTGDVIADLSEDMSAEQKARKTYDNILRLCDDPDVTDVIRFLREREVVHYQRFGEALRLATEKMDQKNVYMTNPRSTAPDSGAYQKEGQGRCICRALPHCAQNSRHPKVSAADRSDQIT